MRRTMTLRFVLLPALCFAATQVACGSGGGFPDAPLPDTPPTAQFSLSWSVIDQDSQPLACSRIGGPTMTVLAHNKAYDGGNAEAFSCSSGMGTSQAVYAGTFDLDFELSGVFGLLARAPSQLSVDIPVGSVTPLQPLVFQVEALGSLALKLSSGASGGNCAAAGSGGAGITAVSISVTRNSDGTCIPMSFAVGAGASTAAGTYATDCTTPADYSGGCIESDQVLSVASVPSDAYTVHVRGKIATTNCWTNNDFIQVPPLQKTLTRTLNLAHDLVTPGC
jgi:hypothetical protein